MQYLTDRRMTLARDYLRTGELTVSQITNRTGHASPSAFATAFRRYHGQPPGQWQRGERELARSPERIPQESAPAAPARADRRGLAGQSI